VRASTEQANATSRSAAMMIRFMLILSLLLPNVANLPERGAR